MDAPVDTAVYIPACLPPQGADYQGKTGELYQAWNDVQNHILWSISYGPALKVVSRPVLARAGVSHCG
jgi:hypothetical protein